MNKRITLVLNSHSLSDFQQCRALFKWTNLVQIEPIETNESFATGTLIHSMLAAHYQAKRDKIFTKETPLEIAKRFIDDNESLSDEDKILIGPRYLRYARFYRDEHWIALAVERINENDESGSTGFSKILYEDKHVLFVYEGEPDLVIKPGYNFSYNAVVDHKSQSRRSDLFEYSNQFRGYCWATQTDHLVINYFGLQATGKPEDWFRRKVIAFTKAQLDQWRNDTIKWYYQIAFAKVNKKFYRSWQCEGKYGICRYIELCKHNHLPFVVKDKLRREFKKKERTKSW